MNLIAIGWGYVAVLMALAEAFGPGGSVLGGVVTLLFYGVLPVALLLYVSGAGARRRARRARDMAALAASSHGIDPSRSRQAPSNPVTPIREEAR